VTLRGRTIGVVFGSRSVEHEISILTACQLMPVLRQLGAAVVPLYITKGGRWLTRPDFDAVAAFREQLPEDGDPVRLDLAAGRWLAGGGSLLGRPRPLPLDALFPCTHGAFGEDGTLAGLAALARTPLVGCGPLAAALAMDKWQCKRVLAAAGLPVVPGRLVRRTGDDPADGTLQQAAAAAAAELGFPLVVKPNGGGSSIGVSRVDGPEALPAAVTVAATYDPAVLLEPAVPSAVDLNCAVKARPPRASEVERPLGAATVLSYADKYVTGGKLGGKEAAVEGMKQARRELPARIPTALRARVQELAVAAYEAVGCRGGVRVDFLGSGPDGADLVVNELNPIPGSLAFYLWEATGVPFAALVEELVTDALAPGPAVERSLPGNLLGPGALLAKGPAVS